MVFERLQITSLLLSFLLNPSLGLYRINLKGFEPFIFEFEIKKLS
jgi:hypothetical protein